MLGRLNAEIGILQQSHNLTHLMTSTPYKAEFKKIDIYLLIPLLFNWLHQINAHNQIKSIIENPFTFKLMLHPWNQSSLSVSNEQQMPTI